MSAPSADQARAAHAFLVKWCIVLALVALAIGALLPHFVSSPTYP